MKQNKLFMLLAVAVALSACGVRPAPAPPSSEETNPFTGLPVVSIDGRGSVGNDGGIVRLGNEAEIMIPKGYIVSGQLEVSIEKTTIEESSLSTSAVGLYRSPTAYRVKYDATSAEIKNASSFETILRLDFDGLGASNASIVPLLWNGSTTTEAPFGEVYSLGGSVMVADSSLSGVGSDQFAQSVSGIIIEYVVGVALVDQEGCEASGGVWQAADDLLEHAECVAPWGSVLIIDDGEIRVFSREEPTTLPYSPKYPSIESDTDLRVLTANVGNSSFLGPVARVKRYKLSSRPLERRIRNNLSFLQPDIVAIQELSSPNTYEQLARLLPASFLSNDLYQARCATYPSGDRYECIAWKRSKVSQINSYDFFNHLNSIDGIDGVTLVGGPTPEPVFSFYELLTIDLSREDYCEKEKEDAYKDTGAVAVTLEYRGMPFNALSVHTATAELASPDLCREQQLLSFLTGSMAGRFDYSGHIGRGPVFNLWMGDFNIDPVRGSAPTIYGVKVVPKPNGPMSADTQRLRWLAEWPLPGLPAEPSRLDTLRLESLRVDNDITSTAFEIERSFDHVIASSDAFSGACRPLGVVTIATGAPLWTDRAYLRIEQELDSDQWVTWDQEKIDRCMELARLDPVAFHINDCSLSESKGMDHRAVVCSLTLKGARDGTYLVLSTNEELPADKDAPVHIVGGGVDYWVQAPTTVTGLAAGQRYYLSPAVVYLDGDPPWQAAFPLDAPGGVIVPEEQLKFMSLRYHRGQLYSWVTPVDGQGADAVYDVDQLDLGTLVVAGATTSSLSGSSNAGGEDAYWATLDTGTGEILTLHQFGGSGHERALEVGVDQQGNVYVGGYTTGTIVPEETSRGWSDAFVAKYDGSGNLLWVRQFGSPGNDTVYALRVTPRGDVYVAGTVSANLDIRSDAQAGSAYIAVFSPEGDVVWAKQFDVAGYDFTRPFTIDRSSSGDVYVAGVTYNAGDNGHAYVKGFSATGDPLWETVLEAPVANVVYFDQVLDLVVSGESIFVTGTKVWAGSSPEQSTRTQDIYVAKFDLAGNLVWENLFGTSGVDAGVSIIASQGLGYIYVLGVSNGQWSNYPHIGGFDATISLLASDGTLLRTRPFGTSGDDYLKSAIPAEYGKGWYFVGTQIGGNWPAKDPPLGSSVSGAIVLGEGGFVGLLNSGMEP